MLSANANTTSLDAPFVNEPLLELRRADVRASLGSALDAVDAQAPVSVPVLVGGVVGATTGLVSTDPGEPEHIVAEAGVATVADVDAAVSAAIHGQAAWAALPTRTRAQTLLRAATWLRTRRVELAALQVRECAKPWPEADADVCEAIDFLEYYARQAVALDARASTELLQLPGERNTMHYAPRGVVAVISPWNFPLAIPTGMTAAALATGNAVVFKPAEQSPGCGLMLVRALLAAGVPADAINLLPGAGDVGAALTRHGRVHMVAFTGSRAVGLEIISAAARVVPGQTHIKHVVAELGGKNCIIVDADADLDEAVPAIVASAFRYAGQKCSAASRVLVHEDVYERLLERLGGAVDALIVGQASTLGVDVPSLIEEEAQVRVQEYIRKATASGRIITRAAGADVPSQGWFCAPTLIADLSPDSPALTEEVFGPLLTVEAVPDVEAACATIESLPVALTAGIFARNPKTIAEAVRRLPVGNLYVNRAITGAMVGRQPFGGSRLSGTGTKAGGPDYLLNFVEPRVLCENTTRHGLNM